MPRPSSTREEILAVAHRLFWRSSFDAVGVDLICREAKVNKGSFYHFFPSKEDVALDLLDDLHRAAREELLEPAFAPELPPLGRFERFLEAMHERDDSDRPYAGCPIGNLILELSTQSERLRQKLEEIIGTYIDTFTSAIEDARKDGSIDPRTDSKARAELIAAAWQGGILLSKAHNDPGLCVRIFRQALDSTFVAAART